MVWMPWIAMMAISSSEYAFTSAEDTLVEAHHWAARPHLLVAGRMGVLPGRGGVPGRSDCGRAASCRRARRCCSVPSGALLGYLSLAYAPHVFLAVPSASASSAAAAPVLVYATCVNMVGKWYPERKGGKTGFVNGGFAYGSVPFIFLFTIVPGCRELPGTSCWRSASSWPAVGRGERLLLHGPAEELVASARRPAEGQRRLRRSAGRC